MASQVEQQTSGIQAIYPANSLQQGFILHAINHPNDDAYHVQTLCDYLQKIDLDCYKKAWELAIQTYPILRACFNWDELPIQIITYKGRLHFTFHDISQEKDKTAALLAIQQADRQLGFDLTQPTLLRLHLIKQNDDLYTLLKNEHHCIGDAWSAPLLLNQVHDYYQKLQQGNIPTVIEDQAYLQAQAYITKEQNAAVHYWQEIVQNMSQANDISRMFSQRFYQMQLDRVQDGQDMTVKLPDSVYQRLQKMITTEGFTLPGVMQFVWHKILHTFTHDTKTIVGTTVSGRDLPIANIEKSVGLYINTLPIMVTWDNHFSIKEQLQHIHQTMKSLNHYSFVHLGGLQKGGERLFHSLLLCEQSAMTNQSIEKEKLSVANRRGIQKLNYPLVLTIQIQQNTLTINLKYEAAYINEERAQQLLNLFLFILQQIPCKLNQPHSQLDLLTPAESEKILTQWNATDSDYPSEETLHNMFSAQAARTPEAVAVKFKNQSLTYHQLEIASNQLGNWLLEQGIERGDLVVLCVERSFEMLIAILGVLKSGAAYVPIDPHLPLERIRYILNDTSSKLVLTQTQVARNLQSIANIPCISLDETPYRNSVSTFVKVNYQASDLAYVIYTSGTTGQPKGAALSHRGIVNRLDWMQRTYSLDANDVVLQKTPYSFDVSVWELLWANWVGATIVIAQPEGHKDPDYLYSLIMEEGVTVLHFVPSMLSVFVEMLSLAEKRLPDTLRYVFCSGEALLPSQVEAFYQISGDRVEIQNLYGPTEASIDATFFACPRGVEKVYIGKPIQNMRVYVLNEYLKPVPVGAIGELYLGGVGLAKEYLHQPVLTSAAFIDSLFINAHDQTFGYIKLYKTGDLVRWQENGNLEYIGRRDFQVKIRGVRIELSEIEHVICQHPYVLQAAALVQEIKSADKNHHIIVAYYVGEVESESLRDYLIKHLSEYMLPSALIRLPAFPTSNNGKLDKRLLPQAEITIENNQNYVAPRNSLEVTLSDIWQTILNVKRVGITDSFFQLGGDSIQSIRLVAMMQEAGFHVSVADVFQHKTILQLINETNHTTAIDKLSYQPYSLIEKNICDQILKDLNSDLIEDIYPASYMQMGMLVDSLKVDANGAYHDVFSYAIQKPLNEERLITLFNQLVYKYPLLRTAFIEQENFGYVCIQYQSLDMTKHYGGIAHHPVDDFILHERYNAFDLTRPGLFKLFVLNPSANEFVLVVSVHHAITDGWSIASLVSEFTSAYINGQGILHEKIPLYQKVIQQESIALQSDVYKNFWQKYLVNLPQPIPNLLLHPEAVECDKPMLDQSYHLTEDENNSIFFAAKRLGVSPDNIFIAAFFKALSQFTEESDLVIGVIMNNRLSETGGDKVFGLHLNNLPLRVNVTEDYMQLIDSIVKNRASLEAYKAYPYSKIRTNIMRGKDIYTCSFNYIHFHVIEEHRHSSRVSSTHVFEKTTVPLTMHVSRYLQRFQIIIKAQNNFIDHQTAEKLMNGIRQALQMLSKQFLRLNTNISKTDGQKILSHTYSNSNASVNSFATTNQEKFIAPSTELEIALCGIWQKLLSVEKVGMTDNFFSLGGDSILSIRLVAMMRTIGFHVSVADIFQHQTIANLIAHTEHSISASTSDYSSFSLLSELDKASLLKKFDSHSIEDIYPASYLQMGMLYESLTSSTSSTYHDIFACIINSEFREQDLLALISSLVQKYPLLRTSFITDKTYGFISIQYAKIDIERHYGGIVYQELSEFIKLEKTNAFILENPGLFRVFVLNPQPLQFVLVISFHHAIADGWSMASLLAECVNGYTENKSILHETLPPYQKVIQRERSLLASKKDEQFWQSYLEHAPLPVTNLLSTQNHATEYPAVEKYSRLETKTAKNVIKIAKRLNTSPDNLFLTAYIKALSDICQQKDIIVGLITNNRLEEKDGDKVFGLHLNTLPLRIKLTEDIFELLKLVVNNKIKLNQYKFYPYHKIRSISQLSTLFVFAFNYLHFHMRTNEKTAQAISETRVFEKTTLPFTLHVQRDDDEFRLSIKTMHNFIDNLTVDILTQKIEANLTDLIMQAQLSLLSPLSKNDYFPFSLLDKKIKDQMISKITEEAITDIYPVSYLQKHMFEFSLIQTKEGTYHDVFAYTIHKALNVELLLTIFKQLSQKHPLLRTAFISHPQYGYLALQYPQIELERHYQQINNIGIDEFIRQERSTPFSFEEPGLFRLFTLNSSATSFVLIFSFHHAIADGWSMASLITEFSSAYLSEKSIQEENIPIYQNVIKQEHMALMDSLHKEFWKKYLENSPPLLPSLRAPAEFPVEADMICLEQAVMQETSQHILSMGKQLNVSVDQIFLAAYAKALHYFTKQSEISIGIMMNHRLEEAGGERIFGLHLNILPLRIHADSDVNIQRLIITLAKDRLQLLTRKNYPYTKICYDLNVKEGFYNCAFNYTHFHVGEQQHTITIPHAKHAFERMTVPLMLQVSRFQNHFSLIVRASNQFIDDKNAAALIKLMQQILAEVNVVTLEKEYS